MSKDEILEMLDYLASSYTNFSDVDGKFRYWNQTLSQYNGDDVWNRLRELMKENTFSLSAPTLDMITRGLTKIADKVDFTQQTYFCMFCRKAFNDYDMMVEHEDRCRSIRYIERQYKRFELGEVNKRELYQMPQGEFDEKYKKLLRLVQARTTNENEKNLIDCIFNPPKEKTSREILGGAI